MIFRRWNCWLHKVMKTQIAIDSLKHILIAVLFPVVVGAYCASNGMDFDYGITGSTFLLFTGLLPIVFVFIGEHSPIFAPTVILVRLAIILHYPYRSLRRPEYKKRMYAENCILTLLTAACGYFIIVASSQWIKKANQRLEPIASLWLTHNVR